MELTIERLIQGDEEIVKLYQLARARWEVILRVVGQPTDVPELANRLRAEQVWFENRMQNHHCSSVLVDGYLYGFGGSNLMCVNFKTGETAWRDRSVGKGSLVYADGHLYCFSERGTVGLIKATPDAYHEVSRFKIEKGRRPTWAHPVVARGKLFLREQDKIYCFDVAKK